ncbi:MAG TPA: alpha/beta hydrolase [Vicinamibacterales bacterium]|nr:alpha/beta hydrolase [Vicinamibacterales bacterium]
MKTVVAGWLAIALAAAAASVTAAQAVREGKTDTGIAYDIRGKGPAVVLITGSNLDRRMWDNEAEWLSYTHTVVRYDLRAHGQSATAVEPFSHLEDLIQVMDELEIERATLVGLSAGSSIAVDAALEHPDRVERIVLAGPGFSGYVSKARPSFATDVMAALKAGDYQKAGEVLLKTSVFASPPEAQALVRRMVLENDRLWKVNPSLMKAPGRPAADRLESIKAPALVLVGEKDELQQEPAQILARRIPDSRLVVIVNGGHLLNLTSPRSFQSAIEEFLGIQ